MRLIIHNRVLLLLAVLLITSLLALPFVNHAPNRLVSGQPLMLTQLPYGIPLLLSAFLLPLLAGCRLNRCSLLLTLLLSEMLFILLLMLSGAEASRLAQQGSSLARTAFGSGLWLVLALCLLIASDTIARLTTKPLWRLLLNGQIWLLVVLLLFSGRLDALALLKEYASRQDIFDQALLRHLLLLSGTLLPALLIGFPLGWLCVRHAAIQSSVFAVLNVIQTVPAIALFGLMMAPLAGLAKQVPSLAEIGISGIGMAPALIALVLYALLPLVRSVVAGIQQVPQEVRETALAMGMTPRQIFWQAEVPLALPVLLTGLRVVCVQTVGMAVVAALIGAGGFGAIIFQGLLSSALELVLLGVIPVIALAVVVDAVFKQIILAVGAQRE